MQKPKEVPYPIRGRIHDIEGNKIETGLERIGQEMLWNRSKKSSLQPTFQNFPR
jgi:hypothetical protein